jgi:Asp-tRNA(Asn)/Glu-tRNA(Gln) amidotransferase A subunit family amidase
MTPPLSLVLSVPVGVASKSRGAGSSPQSVPVGMQIMAGKGREDIVFRTALAIEQRAGFRLQSV